MIPQPVYLAYFSLHQRKVKEHNAVLWDNNSYARIPPWRGLSTTGNDACHIIS